MDQVGHHFLQQDALDRFQEIWVGATFFWEMVEILSKGILSVCNDLDCGPFGEVVEQIFPQNCQLWKSKREKEPVTINVDNICRNTGLKTPTFPEVTEIQVIALTEGSCT